MGAESTPACGEVEVLHATEGGLNAAQGHKSGEGGLNNMHPQLHGGKKPHWWCFTLSMQQWVPWLPWMLLMLPLLPQMHRLLTLLCLCSPYFSPERSIEAVEKWEANEEEKSSFPSPGGDVILGLQTDELFSPSLPWHLKLIPSSIFHLLPQPASVHFTEVFHHWLTPLGDRW